MQESAITRMAIVSFVIILIIGVTMWGGVKLIVWLDPGPAEQLLIATILGGIGFVVGMLVFLKFLKV